MTDITFPNFRHVNVATLLMMAASSGTGAVVHVCHHAATTIRHLIIVKAVQKSDIALLYPLKMFVLTAAHRILCKECNENAFYRAL